MDHEIAVQSCAVERYVLGEMPDDERESFEEHFFECEICSKDVRAGSVFAANTRALAREEAWKQRPGGPSSAKDRGWLGWLQPVWAPAFAMVLLAVVGYQSLVSIPRLNRDVASATAPQQVTEIVLKGQSRGTAAPVELNGHESLLLGFEILPNGAAFDSYDAEILTQAGKRVSTVTLKTPAHNELLHILIPELEPGEYTVVVRGHANSSGPQASVEAGSYKFTLRRK